MASATPTAGNPERVPAALIAEGDPLETLRRISAALPALRAAAGAYAAMVDTTVASGDWDLIRNGLATMAEDDPTRQRVAPCLPYGDALVAAEEAKRKLRADADAADAAAVERVAQAVAQRSRRFDGAHPLPERAEVELEIEAALNPPPADPAGDWQRAEALRRAAICEARGESENSAPWICLYSLERCDGGPEEGGWCYDWLEPIACWRTADYSDPRDARNAAVRHARDRGLTLQGDSGARPVYSVCPDNRVNAIILPAPYPFADASTERPRYE